MNLKATIDNLEEENNALARDIGDYERKHALEMDLVKRQELEGWIRNLRERHQHRADHIRGLKTQLAEAN